MSDPKTCQQLAVEILGHLPECSRGGRFHEDDWDHDCTCVYPTEVQLAAGRGEKLHPEHIWLPDEEAYGYAEKCARCGLEYIGEDHPIEVAPGPCHPPLDDALAMGLVRKHTLEVARNVTNSQWLVSRTTDPLFPIVRDTDLLTAVAKCVIALHDAGLMREEGA